MRRVPLAILTASLALFIGAQRAQSQSSSQSSSGSKQGSAASPQDQSGRTGTTDAQRSAEQTRTNDGQRTGQDAATDRSQGTQTDDRLGGFDRNQPMGRDRAGWNYGDRYGIGSNFPGYRWGYGQPYGDWNRQYGGYPGMYGNFPSDMYGGYGWSGQANDSKARLRVIVPPDARVWVDDQPTRSMGPERLYVSPPLDQGTYSYTVRATWTQDGREVSREKTIKVRPDQMSTADFMAQGRMDQYGSDEAAPRGAEQRQNFDQNRRTPDTDRTPDAKRNESDQNRPAPDTNRDNRPRPGDTDRPRTDQQTPAAGRLNESNRAGQTFSGTIVRAENDQIVVTLQNGDERTFKVASDARITSDGQKSDLRSLKAGMHVSLTANADNSVSVIEATKATTNK